MGYKRIDWLWYEAMTLHRALQAYLCALLSITHKPESASSCIELKVTVPRSISKNNYRSIDVVLASPSPEIKEKNSYGERDWYERVTHNKHVDDWQGVAFEVKVHRSLKTGLKQPFKATEQLFDYRSVGYVPVLVAPGNLLTCDRDGTTLKECTQRIDGACVELQLDTPIDRTGDTVQSILQMEPSFVPQQNFHRRVDERMGFDLSDIFAETPIDSTSESWRERLWLEALELEISEMVSGYGVNL